MTADRTFIVLEIYDVDKNVTTQNEKHNVTIYGEGLIQTKFLSCIYKEKSYRVIPTYISETSDQVSCAIPKVSKSMKTELWLAYLPNGRDRIPFQTNLHSVFVANIDRGINLPEILQNGARFQESLASVNIHFGGPIQTKDPLQNTCQSLFPFDHLKFGNKSRCFVKNRNTLVIQLRDSPSLVSEHLRINLKALEYKSAYLTLYPESNETFLVHLPRSQSPMRVYIKGPKVVCKS